MLLFKLPKWSQNKYIWNHFPVSEHN